MCAAFNKFAVFGKALASEQHNLGSDVPRIALSNTAPTATDTLYNSAGLHPAPAATGGYNTGGNSTTVNSFFYSSSGTLYYNLADTVFTATTSIGPFRYVILYNGDGPSLPLIGWYDYASSITLGPGETFTVDFSAADGVLTLA